MLQTRTTCWQTCRWLATFDIGCSAALAGNASPMFHSSRQVVLHTPIRIVGSRSVSSTTVAARKGWIKPPPQVIRSDILSVSLHKQKPRPVPETFKFSALDSGNTGTVPMCNWNARQREWLVDCLNTIFDNCVTLAPKDGISITTLMTHRKLFARWMYLKLDHAGRDYMRHVEEISKSKLTRITWPIIRDYMRSVHGNAVEESLKLLQIANMTKPHTWYPLASGIQQSVHYHAGPTNSGKTWTSIQALKNASSGVYCAPLRMLAIEVYEKLNESGVPCSLVTGQERIEVPHAKHVACTVEMANITQVVKVAVIDEIQLMANKQRGWAWTRAFLGVPSEELHVCGDHSCIDLTRRLCDLSGKEFQQYAYERLTSLTVDQEGLGPEGYAGLKPGDCVVAFSKRDLYSIRQQIEKATGYRVAIIYGALPPGVRRKQAQLFNEPNSEFKILVASDAIGMGVNLNVRRIIFHALRTFNPSNGGLQTLDPSHIKQIAGRAGRKGTQWETGVTTTRDPKEVKQLERAINMPMQEITHSAAGLLPTFEQIEAYALSRGYPDTCSFADVLQQFDLEAQQEDLYFLCNNTGMLAIARALDQVPGLTLAERHQLCCAPVDEKNAQVFDAFVNFVRWYSEKKIVPLNIRVPEDLVPSNRAEVAMCESAYQVVSSWMWLSLRFAEACPDRSVAEDAEEKLQALISKGLNEMRSPDPAAETADDAEAQRARAEFLTMHTITPPDQQKLAEDASDDATS